MSPKKLLILSLALVSSLSEANANITKHEKWPSYVKVIAFYHRFFPGVYKALEYMPLNKIPEASLITEMQLSTNEWNDFAKKKKGTLADRQKEIQISRNANERLLLLLASNKDFVTLKNVVEAIPSDQRVALTPLDSLFWSSVIGLKAKADLQKIGSDPAQVLEVKVRSEKASIEYSLSDNAKDKYRIRVLEKGESLLRVKGEVSKVRAPTSQMENDSELKVFDLKGAFYQRKEDKLPFGPYPAPQELYQTEDGVTHFRGDGHKHFF